MLLRFAPSPTGSLHLGGLRTALYNHLYSRRFGGKWLLRIEDTDSSRTVPGSVDAIRHALDWAGLDYDYGPFNGGPHAPYHQSERLDLYKFHATTLLERDQAYRCFCSPDRLAFKREALARTGSNKTYDKTCLKLPEEEVVRKIKAGEKYVVRLNDSKLPPSRPINDIVFGQLKDSRASLPTDPILLKSDGFPTYHLASVVDDHVMGITHVVRGEEWLPSLPLHLDLYAIFGFKPPDFAHLPLLLNPDGSKMSKRKGDVQVIDYIRRGWEPEALLNWIALPGWGADRTSMQSSPSPSLMPPDSTAIMTLPELTSSFDLRLLTHRRSILDPVKLEYINKRHLMHLAGTPDGLDGLAHRVCQEVKKAFPQSQYTEIAYLKKVIQSMQSRIKTLDDLPSAALYFFVPPDFASGEAKAMLDEVPSRALYRQVVLGLQERLKGASAEAWDDGALELGEILREQRTSIIIPSAVYMNVLRHALSGMKAGPSVADIMKLLGKARCLQRLKEGWEWVSSDRAALSY